MGKNKHLGSKFEYEYTEYPTCPYCGHEKDYMEMTDLESAYLITKRGGTNHSFCFTLKCDKCGKKFKTREYVVRQYKSFSMEE